MGRRIWVMMTMAFALVVGTPAAWGQAVGGSGKGGGGLLSASAERKTPRYGCEEGRRQALSFADANGNQVTELRTCRNGSYMTDEERAAYIYNPRPRCKEGRLETWTEHTGGFGSDRIRYKRMVCRSGRWVERP